jgi:hypothetical protein
MDVKTLLMIPAPTVSKNGLLSFFQYSALIRQANGITSLSLLRNSGKRHFGSEGVRRYLIPGVYLHGGG